MKIEKILDSGGKSNFKSLTEADDLEDILVLSVDVVGHQIRNALPKRVKSCNVNYLQLTTLKGCPNFVEKDFNCSGNQLSMLAHGPEFVGGSYTCSRNHLTSLRGAPPLALYFMTSLNPNLRTLAGSPKMVKFHFLCHNCDLTSLEHVAEEIGRDFICTGNRVNTLHDIHKMVRRIGSNFNIMDNELQSCVLGLMMIEIGGAISTGLESEANDRSPIDVILNKWKNQGRRGVLGAQRELLDLGYEELAKL